MIMMTEEKIMNRLQKILLIITVIAVIGWVSNQDFEHQQQISQEYTQNVCGGFWPDFKDLRPKCP
jgi:hypothetical protein